MHDLAIVDATILTDGAARRGHVAVDGDRITAILRERPSARRVVAADGRYLSPGLLDLHLNGGAGLDFTAGDADALPVLEQHLLRQGVTAYLAALNTDLPERRRAQLARWATVLPAGAARRPACLGFYLEGPHYAASQCGAHDPALMTDPAPASAADVLAAAAGRVRVWSLAPEREGALPFIAWLAAQGVVPALGHSAADFADVGRAVAAGARLVTHAYACLTAFSGTGPAKRLGGNEGALHHRALTLETLADNAHLTPELLAWLVGTAGWRRLCTTTDAMAAAGLGDGVYRFLEQEVHVVGGRAYRPDRTHFAGSTATVPECLANLQAAAGLTAAEAVATATAVPARLLGRYPEYGAIAPGSVADAVLFDSTWQIDVVIRGGQVVVEGNHPAADVVKAVH